VANEDFVIVHGRYSGLEQPANWIVADIVRIRDGVLVEHWDVIQDEVTKEQSKTNGSRPLSIHAFPDMRSLAVSPKSAPESPNSSPATMLQ
jgi:hypothetical protein